MKYNGRAIGSTTEDCARAINDVLVEVANYFPGIATEPISECDDSSLRFKINNAFTRDCKWVARKNTINRCKFEGVQEMCANTCESCRRCQDSSNRFRLEWKGNMIFRDCTWVKNKQTIMRCRQPGVSDACRATCDVCKFYNNSGIGEFYAAKSEY